MKKPKNASSKYKVIELYAFLLDIQRLLKSSQE